VCFIIHKTTLELERATLTTLYLVGAKNTDSWRARKGDLQRTFPLNVLMVYSPKLSFIANGKNPTNVGLALGETICFSSLEFTANRLGRLSLSPQEGDSGTTFGRMVHSGSPSLHIAIEDSSDEGSVASGEGGSSRSPSP
jgi:hypothetical protein